MYNSQSAYAILNWIGSSYVRWPESLPAFRDYLREQFGNFFDGALVAAEAISTDQARIKTLDD